MNPGTLWHLVLVDAARKIVCHAKIERPMSAAGEQIDVKLALGPRAIVGFDSPSGHSGTARRVGPGTYEHGPRTEHTMTENESSDFSLL